jgi:hypothetical protein
LKGGVKMIAYEGKKGNTVIAYNEQGQPLFAIGGFQGDVVGWTPTTITIKKGIILRSLMTTLKSLVSIQSEYF